MLALCEVTVSQERGFGSNHFVFLKARPQHAMGRCEFLRLHTLQYTQYIIFNWPEVVSVKATGDGTEVGHTSLSSASIWSGEIILVRTSLNSNVAPSTGVYQKIYAKISNPASRADTSAAGAPQPAGARALTHILSQKTSAMPKYGNNNKMLKKETWSWIKENAWRRNTFYLVFRSL